MTVLSKRLRQLFAGIVNELSRIAKHQLKPFISNSLQHNIYASLQRTIIILPSILMEKRERAISFKIFKDCLEVGPILCMRGGGRGVTDSCKQQLEYSFPILRKILAREAFIVSRNKQKNFY